MFGKDLRKIIEWWLDQSNTMDEMTSDSVYIDEMAQKRCDALYKLYTHGLCGTICPAQHNSTVLSYYRVP